MALFNIRVYGLVINDNKEILLSDELVQGQRITKFPGGGLEIGEGTIDCLKREFMEEAGCSIQVLDHFYTTDFYVQSAFNPEHQIISIYYKAEITSKLTVSIYNSPFEFIHNKKITEGLRWLPLEQLQTASVSLPIDKKVVELLLKYPF
jgi:8-oxo-dGTP diphosphatase